METDKITKEVPDSFGNKAFEEQMADDLLSPIAAAIASRDDRNANPAKIGMEGEPIMQRMPHKYGHFRGKAGVPDKGKDKTRRGRCTNGIPHLKNGEGRTIPAVHSVVGVGQRFDRLHSFPGFVGEGRRAREIRGREATIFSSEE